MMEKYPPEYVIGMVLLVIFISIGIVIVLIMWSAIILICASMCVSGCGHRDSLTSDLEFGSSESQ